MRWRWLFGGEAVDNRPNPLHSAKWPKSVFSTAQGGLRHEPFTDTLMPGAGAVLPSLAEALKRDGGRPRIEGVGTQPSSVKPVLPTSHLHMPMPPGVKPPREPGRDIHFIGDLQRLDVSPGDKFVLTVDQQLSCAQADFLRSAWREFIGGDTEQFRLFILDGGAKLGVIRKTAS